MDDRRSGERREIDRRRSIVPLPPSSGFGDRERTERSHRRHVLALAPTRRNSRIKGSSSSHGFCKSFSRTSRRSSNVSIGWTRRVGSSTVGGCRAGRTSRRETNERGQNCQVALPLLSVQKHSSLLKSERSSRSEEREREKGPRVWSRVKGKNEGGKESRRGRKRNQSSEFARGHSNEKRSRFS